MPKLRPRRPLRFLDVAVLSTPFLALGLYLFTAAVLDYHRLRQYDDWWSSQASVARFAQRRALGIVDSPEAAAIESRLDPGDPAKGALQLVLDRAEWDRIGSDVAAHWGTWIEASILDGNDLVEARVRFRGDGSVHWTGPKKSLTVKTKKKDLHQGFRTLALSLKTPLEQYVVNSLGEDARLLTPRTRLVPVYLDRTFYGLHRFVEPVDESFLRKRSRMPGNVWRGDTAERGEAFKGLPRELFRNPYIWDRVAENNRPGVPGREVLEEFLTNLNGDSLEHHAGLWRRLDRDELARMLALCLITGDPFHMSGIHNQLWYEDPSSGVLHPVLWDLRLLELENPPPHSNVNRFWRSALRDPRLWHSTLAWIQTFLGEERDLPALALERAWEAERLHADELAYERLREGTISPMGSAERIGQVLEGNRAQLRGWIDDARAAWSAVETEPGHWLVDVVAEGRAPVRLRGFGLTMEADGPRQPTCSVERRLPDGRFLELSGGVATVSTGDLRWTPQTPESLAPGCAGSGSNFEVEPIAYRFRVHTSTDVRALVPELRNGLTMVPVAARSLEEGAALPSGSSHHPWSFQEVPGRAVLFEGDVLLEEDLVLGPQDRLELAPGTRLRLAPEVSILTRGRLVAEGRADAPITIEAASPDGPWGTLALQGPNTRGSRLAHVSISGGSCALLDGVEYKGMLNVYNASDVTLEDCRLGDNLRCDDALNVVASRVDLIRCAFVDCNLDAADYDLSTGRIADCTFLRSGNDALDLMTAFPAIIGCTIEDSVDKGISVGEGAGPVIMDTRISGCVTGIQTKDRSRPIVLRTEVTGCDVGLHQYAKNWRYDGPGWTRLLDSTLTGNQIDYSSADGAYLTSFASRIDAVAPSAGLGAFDDGQVTAGWWGKLSNAQSTRGRSPLGVLAQVSTLQATLGNVYEDESADPTGGWSASGGVHNLRQRRGGLRARVIDRDGRLQRDVDWHPAPDLGPLALLLEVSSEGLAGIDVSVELEGETVHATAKLNGEPAHFEYVRVPLPLQAVEAITIDLKLAQHEGRLFMKSWCLVRDERELLR